MRRDQHFVAKPPVTSVDDQIADCPGLIVHHKARYMANFSVRCMDVLAGHRIATAQMRIVVTMTRAFGVEVGF